MNETLWAALSEVQDPEMPVNLVDLGVIYGVTEDSGVVEVDLLLRVLGNLECFEDDRISHQDTVAWVVEDA